MGSLTLLALVLSGPHGCATSEAEFWYNRGVRAHHSLNSRISHYTKAIELKPDYARAFYNRGVAHKYKRQYDRAIGDYTEAIRLFKMAGDEQHSVLAFAYNDRGNAYHFNGQYDRAIRDYTEAIRLTPDYAKAFYNRGLAYKIKRQYDRAIGDYTEAIRLEPDYAFAYANRGNTYSIKGVYDRAIEDKTKAITLLEGKGDKPDLAVAYSSRAASYRKKGSYGRAIADVNKAIELKPDYGDAYGHLAWLLATAPDAVFRNGKRAVELAERAVEFDRDAHNLDTLAAAYAEVGRFAEAVSTQLQAIDLPEKEDDESSTANFDRRLERYRSRKPWRMNQPEGGPDGPATDTELNNLAERYRAEGRYAEAESHYMRALAIREKALGPQHQDVATSLNNLALLYRAQGRHAEAAPLFKRSLAIRETARRREAARKRELQQQLEALSGRYITAGGRSKWDISFRDNRFEAHYVSELKRTLLYDGTVTGTRISGRKLHYRSSLCRQSPTTPLYGRIDLVRKSFEVSWPDYNLVAMRKHKRCVPITSHSKWTQADRQ